MLICLHQGKDCSYKRVCSNCNSINLYSGFWYRDEYWCNNCEPPDFLKDYSQQEKELEDELGGNGEDYFWTQWEVEDDCSLCPIECICLIKAHTFYKKDRELFNKKHCSDCMHTLLTDCDRA